MGFRGFGLNAFLRGAGLLAFALVTLTWAMTAGSPQAVAKKAVPGFSVLYSFCQQNDCADGSEPYGGVTVTSAGTIFGTTCEGGTEDDGVLFSLTPTGAETVRANFSDANGSCPDTMTLLAKTADEFYGTTSEGGSGDCGTVFGLTHGTGQKWTYKVLYNFASTDDGCEPAAGLVMDKKGNLYGTTYYGGYGNGNDGYGTIFELSPPKKGNGPWTETILYEFCSVGECTDGSYPGGTLVMDKAGTLYGVTYYGGSEDSGALFALSPYGGETVLYSFCQLSYCADGYYPWGNIAMDASGNLYGTTVYGGAGYYQDVSDYGGTIFEFSKQGHFKTLYSFCQTSGCYDGDVIYSGVILDKSGNLYGTAYYGGSEDCGDVFELLHNAGLALLHSFCTEDDDADGYDPYAPVTMDAKGNLYGTTEYGGTGNDGGVVFKITP